MWVEIAKRSNNWLSDNVTPSRVCELKFAKYVGIINIETSHPHGCVSWNLKCSEFSFRNQVTPSRVCELKSQVFTRISKPIRVTPSRVCELKLCWRISLQLCEKVTPSRVCELKSASEIGYYRMSVVTPSRVCELKFVLGFSQKANAGRHTLTGVWVEIISLWLLQAV